MWRAVDEHGGKLDVLLQKVRDTTAAKLFFDRCYARTRCPGRSLLNSCAATRQQRPGWWSWAGVKHVFVKASARAGNRAENSHQPTRWRKRQMRIFVIHEAHSVSCQTLDRQHFAYPLTA